MKFRTKQRPTMGWINEAFVEGVKSSLGALAKGKHLREWGEGYQLREPSALHGDPFVVKNEDIRVDNAHFWDINPE